MSHRSDTRKPNALIHESSPYLLQHAYNPVEWHAWSDETLQKARTENRLMLISIGYASCHWCHVMEHESFEDPLTAEIMNDKYLCIKVDREERPDVDQVFMTAVHLMGQRGGWPLHCITLPDGKPIYGGTYFPKAQWQKVLTEIHKLWKESPEEVLAYGDRLAEGMKQSELFKLQTPAGEVQRADLKQSIEKWKRGMDWEEGGPNKAPKFPLPNNYIALLRYAHLNADEALLNHVWLTLDKMCSGGIYDALGGGFARYSVDAYWKVPHFEKMLYDNGQLLSLYAEAARKKPNARYFEVCRDTIAWANRELKHPSGAWYSALDADSEGEEGKFYVWKESEIRNLLNADEWKEFEAYFPLNARSFWEHENHVLMRSHAGPETPELNAVLEKLRMHREQRIHPGRDEKILLSWNAMMIRGLCDAYITWNQPQWLDDAKHAMQFILHEMRNAEGEFLHSFKDGPSRIPAFLEDYVWLIEALCGLYEASFDTHWLYEARSVLLTTLSIFPEAGKGMLYYSSDRHSEIITRTIETSDNVIPASNSMLANQLYRMGQYFGRPDWNQRAKEMLAVVRNELIEYGPGYSNWINLALHFNFPALELVRIGENSVTQMQQFRQHYHPTLVMVASEHPSELPLLRDRMPQKWYLCEHGACQLPMEYASEVLQSIQKMFLP